MNINKFDIVSNLNQNFIVIGFFTPNYRPLAEQFAKNLREQNISFHLYARSFMEGNWAHQTLQKPSVLMNARLDYPRMPLIFMDVDCQVRGDISEIVGLRGDFILPIGRKPMKNGTGLRPGTRVMVVKPTPESDIFLAAWNEKCRLSLNPVGNDEIRLQMALEECAGHFSFSVLPRKFNGQELRKAEINDVIIHDSARDEMRFAGAIRKNLKSIFRRVRNLIYQVITGNDYARRKN